MLNAIVWTAKLEVPENGVPIENVNLAALKDNQDFDEPKKLDVEKIRKVHGVDSK